jgi:hypothetical protein
MDENEGAVHLGWSRKHLKSVAIDGFPVNNAGNRDKKQLPWEEQPPQKEKADS